MFWPRTQGAVLATAGASIVCPSNIFTAAAPTPVTGSTDVHVPTELIRSGGSSG